MLLFCTKYDVGKQSYENVSVNVNPEKHGVEMSCK